MTYFETQALGLFFQGLDTVEIGEKLGITEAKAERHLHGAFDAMRRRKGKAVYADIAPPPDKMRPAS